VISINGIHADSSQDIGMVCRSRFDPNKESCQNFNDQCQGTCNSFSRFGGEQDCLANPLLGGCACTSILTNWTDLNETFVSGDIVSAELVGVPGSEPEINTGNDRKSVEFSQFLLTTGVGQSPDPKVVSLSTPFPNPSSDGVSLRFGLPSSKAVRVQVFAIDGRLVATLADGIYSAGWHTLSWRSDVRGARMANGVYYAKLTTAGISETRKFMLLR
jgi:hypothetical protein